MNPKALKAALKKLETWVKKNPKKAALAGVVVGILIYFAIRQGSSSDGESLAGGEATSDTSGLDSFGGGLSAAGGGDSSSIGGGGSSGDSAPPISGGVTNSDFTSSGGVDDSSFGFDASFLPEFPATGFVNSSPAFPASSASIVSGSNAPKQNNTLASVGVSLAKLSGASKPSPASVEVSGANKQSNTLASVGVSLAKLSGASKPSPASVGVSGARLSGASKPSPVVPKNLKPATTKTDAEKAGLPKYFTGVSNGKRYALGIFVGRVLTSSSKKPNNSLKPKSSKKVPK